MTTKDYSLLRPFDLEAARRGEPICWASDGEMLRYVGAAVSKGHCVEFLEGEHKGRFETYPTRDLRMAPLAWVRVSADDPTLRPVYKGDVLWLKKAASKITADGTARNGNQQDCIISGFETPDDEMWWPLESLTWTPPKVKREGWVNLRSGTACKMASCYSAWASHSFATIEIANEHATPDRIACVRIEWEEPTTTEGGAV